MDALSSGDEFDKFDGDYLIGFQSVNRQSKQQLKRVSIDYGYESILSSHSFNTTLTAPVAVANQSNDASHLNVPASHHISSQGSSQSSSYTSDFHFSQPTTPVKSSPSYFYNNLTTTSPDFKQQYVADVNGIYLASIKSQQPQSPIIKSYFNKTSANFSEYSPMKPAINKDSYLNERDNFNSKLLRSPAFKLPPQQQQQQQQEMASKPVIKSFSARFSEINEAAAAARTQTQEEFMDILVRNRHMPTNPEFLIGRHMGLEQIDILSELNKRSMRTIIEQINSYLSVNDYVRMAGVSKEWRQIVKRDKKANIERIKFIKLKHNLYETCKENFPSTASAGTSKRESLNASEKRSLFKAQLFSRRSSIQSITNSMDTLNPLDINCINNVEDDEKNSVEFLNGFKLKHSSNLFEELSNTAGAMEIGSSSLIRTFKQISMDDNQTISKKTSAKLVKYNSVCSANNPQIIDESKIDVSAHFICKHLKVSPIKSSIIRSSPLKNSPTKIELIGSKKSKKNLKRL